ncbi:MAG: four helix bundle protein [Candidatus Uhrbacteria bacterium]|nr:four helix bundle protein [Candidatus Uhrbacteria bacterium]
MQGDYRKLTVWHKAMDLVVLAYKLTETFPRTEQYGLTSQMRRAAVSIPSNIAEGRRRGTDKEVQQFFRTSFGSGAELETQLEISERLGFGSEELREATKGALDEVMRMLNGLLSS